MVFSSMVALEEAIIIVHGNRHAAILPVAVVCVFLVGTLFVTRRTRALELSV